MDIWTEQEADIDEISKLTRAAFRDVPYSDQTEAAIIHALRRAGALTLSLVAVDEGHVVGHVAFSPVTIDGEDLGWFGLGPVSVWPEHQQRGIGSALIREGLQRLRKSGARGCVLLGDPAYYSRFGFTCDPGLVFPPAPAEYFQRLAFEQPVPSGIVCYHAAFGVE